MTGPSTETDTARFARVGAIFDAAGFLHTLGVRLDAVGRGTCKTSLALTPAHLQQHGFAHAGVITTLADHTAGGAARAALPPGRDVLTLERKINILRPGRGERLIARGRTLRAGRTVVVSEADVFAVSAGLETHVARLSSTLTVLDERPFATRPARSR
jgi:uncharacterized protein (TIGR00369 family)